MSGPKVVWSGQCGGTRLRVVLRPDGSVVPERLDYVDAMGNDAWTRATGRDEIGALCSAVRFLAGWEEETDHG